MAENARKIAAEEKIKLVDDYWDVINFMRDYYEDHQIAPDACHVLKHVQLESGADRSLLFQLFPYGYVQQASKIASMKRLRAWSTV